MRFTDNITNFGFGLTICFNLPASVIAELYELWYEKRFQHVFPKTSGKIAELQTVRAPESQPAEGNRYPSPTHFKKEKERTLERE